MDDDDECIAVLIDGVWYVDACGCEDCRNAAYEREEEEWDRQW